MATTFDSWFCEMPTPPHVNHYDGYPEGYECRCGGDLWAWDSEALAWACEDCGDYLDQGAYQILTPAEQREEAMLDRAGL